MRMEGVFWGVWCSGSERNGSGGVGSVDGRYGGCGSREQSS